MDSPDETRAPFVVPDRDGGRVTLPDISPKTRRNLLVYEHLVLSGGGGFRSWRVGPAEESVKPGLM